MEKADFNEFILANIPSFIAVNYQRLLEAQQPQEQVALILHIYNLGLRVLTINLVSQYVFRDRDRISNPYLDDLLKQNFLHLTPDSWKQMLFRTLRAYEGNRDLFFMPELYDFYWDTSTYPHEVRAGVMLPFERLTQATLEQTRGMVLQDESEWYTLAQELLRHLRAILHSLSFIGAYELIHVLNQDEHSYTLELHKGVHILIEHRPLPQHTRLSNGWFYLRSSTGEFLALHPLLVFWEEPIEPTDTGVFDRWVSDRLRYLLATPGQTRLDEKRIRDFVKLIYMAITEVKREQEPTEKLSWLQLCDICNDITLQRMATVQGKYQQELYLQRESARQHMEAFLADPKKRGFVLVGKSGVGKSNFLLALAEELRERNNVCVLMYDGANLPINSSALTDIIGKDVGDRGMLSQQPVQQIWQEIAHIHDINERLVVLCVDAVNENLQATALLKQLDELVQSAWPWLKIVLSSRPETWQSIKRGVKLAEALYYREPETERLGVELEPFSYSEQMEPFSRQELPDVYNKYQRTFHLQTPYEALSHELRETLRDPLQLWLLARTYQRQAIPGYVKTSALIEQYVNVVLQREERRFLEQQLVPLMVKEGHYSNAITEAELDAAGGALYEMVYSEQVLSDGRRMNQSFLKLCDADILVLQEQENKQKQKEQRITFKYERFYENFAGKRIAGLSETQPDRYTFFLALIKETTGKPFLWGAVRNALIEEAKKPNSETILKQCRTTEQRVKEMIVNVLITLGLDDPERVKGILEQLIPQEKQVSELQKVRQVVSEPAEAPDVRTRNARKIAIEVASTLKLGWVLQTAALQPDPTTRAVAVRFSYYLWQRDQAAGFEILEYVAKKATAGLLPDFLAFESVMGLSVIIFCEHYQDKEVLSRLQGIWRGMIAKLFRVREGVRPWKGIVRDFIREQIISFAITLVFRLIREFPGYNMVNYQKLEAFFQLGSAEKTLYRNLIHYIDVDGEYSKEQMERDYLAAIHIDNVLLIFPTLMGLVAHGCRDPQAFLPFLKQLFEEAKKDVGTYHALSDIANVADNILVHYPMIDELFDFFVQTVETCHVYDTKYPQVGRNRSSEAPKTKYLGPYIFHQYRRAGTIRTAWFETPIQAELSENDILFFDLLITVELPFVAFERQEPRAALAALELFFKSGNAQVNQLIMAFLSRLRVYYPDEVEDFLEEQQAPDDFCLQVRTNEPVEKVGDLIGQRSLYFVRDSILLGSSELRSQIQLLFAKAADCKDTRAWMQYMVRQWVNMIYGGQVLHISG